MNGDVRYRFYCDSCATAGAWVKTADEARMLEGEHGDEHNGDFFSSRIQRFPLEEIERGDVR